jgi:hypothetical protein
MTTPIAKGQLLQLGMVEQWFATNVEMMTNAVISSEGRPPIKVSYPFMAFLIDQARLIHTPDDRSLFLGCELTLVDEAAFVWEIA